MPDPNRPHDDPVMHPDAEHPRDQDRDAQEGGTGAAILASLGCLGFSIFPWLVAGVVIVVLLMLAVAFQSCSG